MADTNITATSGTASGYSVDWSDWSRWETIRSYDYTRPRVNRADLDMIRERFLDSYNPWALSTYGCRCERCKRKR